MSTEVIERFGLDASYVPRVETDAVMRFYGNEAIAWSPTFPNPAYLDPVGATLIQVFDGAASIADLVTDVCEAVAVPDDVAIGQIARVIGLLHEHGLLVDADVQHIEADSEVFSGPPNP